MKDKLWRLVARIVSRPAIAAWLIERAVKTPYTHIGEGDDVYMYRFWLFNPYPGPAIGGETGGRRRWGDWLPSIRIHGIMRADDDRHCHDHPWDARTVILAGWYREERLEQATDIPFRLGVVTEEGDCLQLNQYLRTKGDTAPVLFGHYHRITHVSIGGAWTLFITWKYQGTWGFLVDGVKVPYKRYFAQKRKEAAQ